MKSLYIAVVAGLGCLAATVSPSLAAAINGYATSSVNERAGPDTSFPSIIVIPAGAAVTIYGCVQAGDWCDVDWSGNRGWVSATYLQSVYGSQRVAVPVYRAQLGIPFISFDLGVYWGTHYRSRPFFADRGRWDNWHPGQMHPPFHTNPWPGQPRYYKGKPTYVPGNTFHQGKPFVKGKKVYTGNPNDHPHAFVHVTPKATGQKVIVPKGKRVLPSNKNCDPKTSFCH